MEAGTALAGGGDDVGSPELNGSLSAGLGDGVFSGFGVLSGSGVSLAFGVVAFFDLCFAPSGEGRGVFSPATFFFVTLAGGVVASSSELFFLLRAAGLAPSSSFDSAFFSFLAEGVVVSSSADSFFLVLAVAAGVASSPSDSALARDGDGLADGVLVGDGLDVLRFFFGVTLFFGLGDFAGVGDSSASSCDADDARFFSGAGDSARRKPVSNAVAATVTPAQRSSRRERRPQLAQISFTQAAAPKPAPLPLVPAPGARSRLIYRRAAATNRLDTSMLAGR